MGERRLPGLGGAAGLLRQSCFAFDSDIDGVRVAYHVTPVGSFHPSITQGGVRWHTLPMTAVASTERTYAHFAAIADRLALQFDETVAAMDDAVIEVVPAFGADAAISAELTQQPRPFAAVPGGGAACGVPAIGRGPA